MPRRFNSQSLSVKLQNSSIVLIWLWAPWAYSQIFYYFWWNTGVVSYWVTIWIEINWYRISSSISTVESLMHDSDSSQYHCNKLRRVLQVFPLLSLRRFWSTMWVCVAFFLCANSFCLRVIWPSMVPCYHLMFLTILIVLFCTVLISCIEATSA